MIYKIREGPKTVQPKPVHIKAVVKNSYLGAMSATEPHTDQPRTLADLCKVCNIPMHSLQLPCAFCKKTVCTADIYAFQYKDLFVVWRHGFPHAACALCLELHGQINYRRHRDRACLWETVEQECGRPLEEIFIRCWLCHKPLCNVEKQRHVDYNRRFHCVRGYWKGRCLHCWKP
uniref:Protein E6 n=1 Tax=Human papillomavirus type 54 TaxID=1671798 RepID=A0A0P0F0X1_HPV54|nr:early protein E6 [Human papillomavirus type 54]